MLLALGQRTQRGDVTDLLVACHHRVREHLALARRIAHAPVSATLDSIRMAARRVHTYFATAFPLHRQDEEDDIFPRLLGRDDNLDIAIAELMRDHGEHEAHVAELVELCVLVEHEPARLHVHAAHLGECVRVIEDELASHLALEERTVFPAIDFLSVADRQAILERMRARRALPAASLGAE